MEKSLLYFIAKIVAVITSVSILQAADVDITFTVISTLSFACIFLIELLFVKIIKRRKIIVLTIGISIVACFALGLNIYFPLYTVLLVHLLDLLVSTEMFYYILGVAVLLSALISLPGITALMIVLLLLTMLLYSRILIMKLHSYQESNDQQKELIVDLNKKVTDLKGLTKTLKYSVSIEERNRIAARIHDQLGHGISGSIILLEAAMLILKDQPKKAEDTIQKAITNLREGVDAIRTSLREERADHYLIGLNDIKATLEEFKISYDKAVELKTSGDLDLIAIPVWACIHDNLKECLTNVLKHSNATEFTLNIEVFKKIIKIEYKDNGSSSNIFEKGIGLEAIEERTVKVKGRCLISKGEKGFQVTNIFTY
jgi:signal transduction histidine kinase